MPPLSHIDPDAPHAGPAAACERCARLERQLEESRRESDARWREAERYRREAERAGGQLWSLECQLLECEHDLEMARAAAEVGPA